MGGRFGAAARLAVVPVVVLGLAGCRSETPRDSGPAVQPPPVAERRAVGSPTVEERLEAAREIRDVVQRFLRDSPEQARSQLPSDWAQALPLEAGAVSAEPDGAVRIGPWRLELEGDGARLDHYPAGAITARHRIWFRIELARKASGWEILPPGVSFVHAWAKER